MSHECDEHCAHTVAIEPGNSPQLDLLQRKLSDAYDKALAENGRNPTPETALAASRAMLAFAKAMRR